jgi:hypothetical protein
MQEKRYKGGWGATRAILNSKHYERSEFIHLYLVSLLFYLSLKKWRASHDARQCAYRGEGRYLLEVNSG